MELNIFYNNNMEYVESVILEKCESAAMLSRLKTQANTKLHIFQNKIKCVKNLKATYKFCSKKTQWLWVFHTYAVNMCVLTRNR